MKKRAIVFLLFGTFVGWLVREETVSATTFESMKERVEAGEGSIYNPISNEVMGQERSLEYIEFIEEATEESVNQEVLEEVQIKAFNETKSTNTETMEALEVPKVSNLVRGMSPPHNKRPIYLDNFPTPYQSSPFSGSGWRFSGQRFSFHNVRRNPYFGVRAYRDTFTFFDGMYNRFVPISNNFVYYSSSFRGSPLIGYFATWNPINGSRYFIY